MTYSAETVNLEFLGKIGRSPSRHHYGQGQPLPLVTVAAIPWVEQYGRDSLSKEKCRTYYGETSTNCIPVGAVAQGWDPSQKEDVLAAVLNLIGSSGAFMTKVRNGMFKA